MSESRSPTIDRITEYLSNGGLFNPEAMDQFKVRDILMDCRADLAAARAEIERLRKDAQRKLDHLLEHCADPECTTCGTIICEHGEWLHFHHDGCPACDRPPPSTVLDAAIDAALAAQEPT